jgi:hypothetical protein
MENLPKNKISFVVVPIISSQTLRFFGAKAFLCLFSFLISSQTLQVCFRNQTERKEYIFPEGKYILV